MPNEYSVEIHHYISEQIAIHEQKILSSHGTVSETERSYSRGALKELTLLRSYLAEKIDLKNYTYY